MALKGFAKVISTHDGDVLVEKTNPERGENFGLKITCLTNNGNMVTAQPSYPNQVNRDAVYRSFNNEVAKKFIDKMERRFK